MAPVVNYEANTRKQQHMPLPDTRGEAANIISQWLRQGRFPDRLLDDTTDARNHVAELVYGVAKMKGLLEYVLDARAKRVLDRAALPYLLVGAYQILFVESIPVYAAINETVNAVGASKTRFAKGFVNAMLRSVARDRDAILKSIPELPGHIRYSHPEKLYSRWVGKMGRTTADALCEWNNTIPSLVIAPNLLKISMKAFVNTLTEAGIEATPHTSAPERFLTLAKAQKIGDVPGYAEGMFSVQDPSTWMAVELLDAQPGDRVLDACAAPGGKTSLIVQCMKDVGVVWAVEKKRPRLIQLKDNMFRMGYKSVKCVELDASVPDQIRGKTEMHAFDRILLDVPCSNTGVFRRRADARWRFDEDMIARQRRLQMRLLQSAAPLVAPAGILVYSTCSLEREEGHDLVSEFLSQHPELTLEQEKENVPPSRDMDGAYAARIRRRIIKGNNQRQRVVSR